VTLELLNRDHAKGNSWSFDESVTLVLELLDEILVTFSTASSDDEGVEGVYGVSGVTASLEELYVSRKLSNILSEVVLS
jgi:hypothetical protein